MTIRKATRTDSPRHLIIVPGDQLCSRGAALDGFDARKDAVWMTEVEKEITHV